MFALTLKDKNFKENTISISKTYQRIKETEIITKPKTVRSLRVVSMPGFIVDKVKKYIEDKKHGK